MAKNFGKTIFAPINIPALLAFKVRPKDPDVVLVPAKTVYQQQLPNGTPWKDVATAEDGTFFIAVADDGRVICCEADPTMVAVPSVDIWQIEHDGPRAAIFMRRWDGTRIVEEPET